MVRTQHPRIGASTVLDNGYGLVRTAPIANHNEGLTTAVRLGAVMTLSMLASSFRLGATIRTSAPVVAPDWMIVGVYQSGISYFVQTSLCERR
jgi:hypothetical protein